MNKTTPREVEILVLSDLHLGTYGCHAKELLQYFQTINPKMVVLNGDIIDAWQFSKSYFPPAHMAVVQYFMDLMQKQIPVYFIPGNHDEVFRKFKGLKIGSLSIDNKLSIMLNGKKIWIFHGDVFDVVMQHSKWLSKLGAVGYDILILINRMCNFISQKLGRGKISLSKKVKNSVKSAVKFINNFESTICGIAAEEGFDYVICGHIHEPVIKSVVTPHGMVQYLNSGDWIENLTALEFNAGEWKLYKYTEDFSSQNQAVSIPKNQKNATKEILHSMLTELKGENAK